MMKVIQTGTQFKIYDEGLVVLDKIPNNTFTVCFTKEQGFFLEKRENLSVSEKTYGNHDKKVDKILKSYSISNRNFGVILSGDKGIGKSLVVRMLSKKGFNQNLPTVIVNKYIDGLADFISSISQEIIVVFDEFDKNFSHGMHGSKSEQNTMLSLFDGMDNGKKLFVITCNSINNLSAYYVNRTGRFHYHIVLKKPNIDEILEYMNDNVDAKYKNEIDKILKYARISSLTYDILRAVCFDINQGYDIDEIFDDLNHENDTYDIIYMFELELSNGVKLSDTLSTNTLSDNTKDGVTSLNIDLYGKNRSDVEVEAKCEIENFMSGILKDDIFNIDVNDVYFVPSYTSNPVRIKMYEEFKDGRVYPIKFTAKRVPQEKFLFSNYFK